jgi:hypothetical protein
MTENLTEEWINHSSASHFKIQNIFVYLSKPMLHFPSAFFSIYPEYFRSFLHILLGKTFKLFKCKNGHYLQNFPFHVSIFSSKSSEIMMCTLDNFISGKILMILLDRVNQFI